MITLEELINQTLQAHGIAGSSAELVQQVERQKVEEYNARDAKEHPTGSGTPRLFDAVYDCPLCKNKGFIAFLDNDGRFAVRDCQCRQIRESLMSAAKSGLGDLRTKRVHNFSAAAAWQVHLRKQATEFIQTFRSGSCPPQKGFVVLGQSGCGKTHLCAAVCNFFIDQGKKVRYMSWLNTADELKILRVEEPSAYRRWMEELSSVDVLYIDDLFKAKSIQGISERDVTLAFEILNHRLNLPDCVTVVSSEWLAEDLKKVDTAVTGRLLEIAGCYLLQIPAGDEYNYRIQRGCQTDCKTDKTPVLRS